MKNLTLLNSYRENLVSLVIFLIVVFTLTRNTDSPINLFIVSLSWVIFYPIFCWFGFKIMNYLFFR